MRAFDEFLIGCQIIRSIDGEITTYAEHDSIMLAGEKDKDDYSTEIRAQLEELGFHWSNDCWHYFT